MHPLIWHENRQVVERVEFDKRIHRLLPLLHERYPDGEWFSHVPRFNRPSFAHLEPADQKMILELEGQMNDGLHVHDVDGIPMLLGSEPE